MSEFQVTEGAVEVVRQAWESEDNHNSLGLWIEVAGREGDSYSYDVFFQDLALAGLGDEKMTFGPVSVVIPQSSAALLDGARLELSSGGELVIVNPNSPPPSEIPEFGPEALANDAALRVQATLEEEINPAIAAHGGFVELMGVKDGVAYLVMGGGCQGCGLAAVTLSQGITVAIKEAVPEIRDIVDMTNHMAGTNPYFAGEKK